MDQLIVSKFGGTSMGDVPSMQRSAKIVADRKSKVVVVSATSGTTNELIQLGKSAQSKDWKEIESHFEGIRNRHVKMSQEIGLSGDKLSDLKQLFEEMHSLSRGIFLLRDCSEKALDVLMSLGERMSSCLFAKVLEDEFQSRKLNLKAVLFDVRKVLITDDQFGRARPNTDAISKLCKDKFKELRRSSLVYVTQGFIGATEEGNTTTLGRGGSDYSAAILAEGVAADILEIWTDVAGIATTDPRICPSAKVIPEITFKEASELATFGAKILHPATLVPAIRQKIPVFVGSSFDASLGGTWVRKEASNLPVVRALALRTKQVLVTLSTPEMLNAHGFLFQIFKVFNDYGVSVDAITTSEISVSLTVDESTLHNKKLFSELEKIAEVLVEKDLTLVALIGNNINHTPGLGKKIFEAISDINVRMICLGASRHNFCFLVDANNGAEALTRLHKIFI